MEVFRFQRGETGRIRAHFRYGDAGFPVSLRADPRGRQPADALKYQYPLISHNAHYVNSAEMDRCGRGVAGRRLAG